LKASLSILTKQGSVHTYTGKEITLFAVSMLDGCSVTFLLCNAMLEQYFLSLCVCLSVCHKPVLCHTEAL